MSDYISKSAVIELIESKMTDGCLGTEDDTFICGHGLVDDISDLPTVDEKEIIRKPMERILERLEEEATALEDNFGELIDCIPEHTAIEIVKEEGEDYSERNYE